MPAPAVVLRPQVRDQVGAVLVALIVVALATTVAVSPVPAAVRVVFCLPVLWALAFAWAVLATEVVLDGPGLTVRGPLGRRRLDRPDVVAVVQAFDVFVGPRRRVTALRLTAGGLLRLHGAAWPHAAAPLQAWLDTYCPPVDPRRGRPGPGAQGWSGPVVP